VNKENKDQEAFLENEEPLVVQDRLVFAENQDL
jgi:hypothetical protein